MHLDRFWFDGKKSAKTCFFVDWNRFSTSKGQLGWLSLITCAHARMSTARLLYKEKKPSILSRPSIKAGIKMICLHRSTQIAKRAQNYQSIEISTHFSSLDWSTWEEEEEWFIIFSLIRKFKRTEWLCFRTIPLMNEKRKEGELFAIDAAKIS